MQLSNTLPIGKHDVTYHAWNPAAQNNPNYNLSSNVASCTLTIHVRDKEAPAVLECPNNIDMRLYPGSSGQFVYWREPRFVDNVAVVTVKKSQVKKTSDSLHSIII